MAGKPLSAQPIRASSEAAGDSLEPDRGRHARYPTDLPAAGWRDIAWRVWEKMGHDHVSLLAAGIALNTLLAIFPALALAVSIYGLFSSPAGVAADVRPFFAILPPEAAQLVQDELEALVGPKHAKLGLGAVVSALLAFWSARQGIAAVVTATNVAYYERECRSYLRQIALSLGFTIASVAAFLVMLGLGVAVPLALRVLPLGPAASAAILVCRWLLIWLFAVGALAVVYRYAPDRRYAQWPWVTGGSIVAATIWLLGSVLFELYVDNFSSYGATYGALGGVVVLIMWFYLGGYAVVIGAEINAEMEHQTTVDTTVGPPKPMGQRGAYVADTLGPTP